MTPRGPQKQFDRDEVLERAMELFWSQGYEATGMTELVERMGIGRQSLYDTFGDKRALFTAAVTHYFQSQVGPVVGLLRAPGSPLANLKKVFDYWESMIGEDAHGCLIGNSIVEFGQDNEMGPVFCRYLDGMEDEFCDLMRRAREAGEIATDLSDRDLASLLVLCLIHI